MEIFLFALFSCPQAWKSMWKVGTKRQQCGLDELCMTVPFIITRWLCLQHQPFGMDFIQGIISRLALVLPWHLLLARYVFLLLYLLNNYIWRCQELWLVESISSRFTTHHMYHFFNSLFFSYMKNWHYFIKLCNIIVSLLFRSVFAMMVNTWDYLTLTPFILCRLGEISVHSFKPLLYCRMYMKWSPSQPPGSVILMLHSHSSP